MSPPSTSSAVAGEQRLAEGHEPQDRRDGAEGLDLPLGQRDGEVDLALPVGVRRVAVHGQDDVGAELGKAEVDAEVALGPQRGRDPRVGPADVVLDDGVGVAQAAGERLVGRRGPQQVADVAVDGAVVLEVRHAQQSSERRVLLRQAPGSPRTADDGGARAPRSSASTRRPPAGRVRGREPHAGAADHRGSPCPEGRVGRCYVPPEAPDRGETRDGDRHAAAAELHRRRARRRRRGRDRARPQPGHRAGDRARRRASASAGRRPRRRGRPARVRGLVERPRRASAAALLKLADAIEAARRRARRAGGRATPASRSQAVKDDEIPRDGRQPALLRGRRAQHGGQGRRRVPRGLHVAGCGASRSASSARSRRGTTR